MFNKPINCVEPDADRVRISEAIAKKLGINNKVRFIMDSLPKLSVIREKYDQVFLMHVLGHVKEDFESLVRINAILKLGGSLVISVPTPNYPKYCCREFTERIAHVRDGYTIEELRRLLEASGFRILKYSYYANLLSPSSAGSGTTMICHGS